ncbi:hypothetical protein F4225_15065 [Candidatus Poribacteria bacterium]|nr:hypothetical protein [Candidatus Poribacteria bacterium]
MKKHCRVLTYLTLMLTCFLIGACQQTSDTNKNRRTSVLGLGPYPKVSKGALDMFLVATADDLWDGVEEIAKSNGVHLGLMEEFKKRVRLKLFEQGIKTVGISARSQNGDNSTIRIYPLYPKVAYVQWKYKNDANGKPQRYAFQIIAPGNKDKLRHYFDRGRVPLGWKVKSYEEDALDPYLFLGLERFRIINFSSHQ